MSAAASCCTRRTAASSPPVRERRSIHADWRVARASVPSFFRPTIATAQPLVKAGDAVSLHGQHFPTPVNLATALPVGS